MTGSTGWSRPIFENPGGPSLFPTWEGHPYYIVAPDYIRTSAGVKALHLLCHSLNARGRRAYIISGVTSPALNTPPLTHQILDEHHREKLTPIVLYCETSAGNPMGAACVVRYLLNFAGHLGGGAEFPGELLLSYGRGMTTTPEDELVLHIPVADTRRFYPPPPGAPRSGGCFYAGKYRDVHGGVPLPITDGMIEFTRSGPATQDPEDIADVMRRSEWFYAYENTTLSLEALLCGCPVILVQNPHFKSVIASEEHQMLGMAWGDSPEEKARARSQVEAAQQRYAQLVRDFWPALDRFIDVSQARAAQTTQTTRIEIPVFGSFPFAYSRSEWSPPARFAMRVATVVYTVLSLVLRVGPLAAVRSIVDALKPPDRGPRMRYLLKEAFSWIRDEL